MISDAGLAKLKELVERATNFVVNNRGVTSRARYAAEWLRTPEIQALLAKANQHGAEAAKLEGEALKAAGLDPDKYAVDVERRGFIPQSPPPRGNP